MSQQVSNKAFPTRQLGKNGPLVSAIGLGAMGIGGFYGKTDLEEIFHMLSYAADNGITFWDTADIYGSSEASLGEWFATTKRREEIFLATKFGYADLRPGADWSRSNSQPSYIRRQVAASLAALQTTYIDLYYQHRPDPNVPIEIVLETLRPYVEEGVIKWVGLSECSADMLKRAKGVPGIGAKVVVVQMEYSAFELGHQKSGFLDAAKKLGVALVAYSPLGRGLVSGRFRSRADFDQADMRLNLPRFSEVNLSANVKLADQLSTIAAKYDATASQLALAWIMAEDPSYIPIPGSRTSARLQENANSIQLLKKLTGEDLRLLKEFVENADVQGQRMSPQYMKGDDCLKLEDWKGEADYLTR